MFFTRSATQGRIVEEGPRHRQQPAARQERDDETKARTDHVEAARAKHLADTERRPRPGRALSVVAPMQRGCVARTAALIAPAEVPHRIGNGKRERGGYQLAIACSTPTW